MASAGGPLGVGEGVGGAGVGGAGADGLVPEGAAELGPAATTGMPASARPPAAALAALATRKRRRETWTADIRALASVGRSARGDTEGCTRSGLSVTISTLTLRAARSPGQP